MSFPSLLDSPATIVDALAASIQVVAAARRGSLQAGF